MKDSDVPRYDSESVRALFDEMAATYGPVNVISSFGFAVRWRHQAVAGMNLHSAESVVDLMSGMGELWRSLARILPGSARVLAIDISPGMAGRAKRRQPFVLDVKIADALREELPAQFADAVVSSFGLKTFDAEQQRRLAFKVAQILKPGGEYSFIEISVPPSPPLRVLYMFYLKRVIPFIGRLMLGNPDNYRMLGIYTEAFGDAAHFRACLADAGLEAAQVSYFFGCASGVRGRKR
jgi:demethylmenaquinone methyltransferase/2-methoxy-6-polyprenyl-1,4-benzoquinol methylase